MSDNVVHVYVDIETIPDQREGAAERAAARVKAPSNYKDPDKIAAYVAEKGAEAHASTSLDAAYGQVFCIGYAVEDGPVVALVRQDVGSLDDERQLLVDFYSDLYQALEQAGAPYGHKREYLPTFVGHRVTRFDLRFLWQRSLVHRVQPTVRLPYDASPYSNLVVDTSMLWTGDGRDYVTLDKICDALGIESPKDELDGGQVWNRVQAGDWQSVVDYNVADVAATRRIHQLVREVRGF